MDIDLVGYVKRELLSIPRAKWPEIAAAAGVGKSTVEKLAYGVVTNPGSSTVQSLANVLMNRAPAKQQAASSGRGNRGKPRGIAQMG